MGVLKKAVLTLEKESLSSKTDGLASQSEDKQALSKSFRPRALLSGPPSGSVT